MTVCICLPVVDPHRLQTLLKQPFMSIPVRADPVDQIKLLGSFGFEYSSTEQLLVFAFTVVLWRIWQ